MENKKPFVVGHVHTGKFVAFAEAYSTADAAQARVNELNLIVAGIKFPFRRPEYAYRKNSA